MNNKLMFSSATDLWATPPEFFEELDREFHFNLDPCANEQNHKTPRFYTKEDDGLTKDWGGPEYSATRLTAERPGNGSRKHTRRGTSPRRSSSSSFRPGRIRHTSTTTFSAGARSGSSADGSSSEGARIRRPSPRCSSSIAGRGSDKEEENHERKSNVVPGAPHRGRHGMEAELDGYWRLM
jgi:hypothetical protein